MKSVTDLFAFPTNMMVFLYMKFQYMVR